MSQTITVGISDLNIARAPDILVTYALGSCIGICLYDARVKLAGLSHIMLPSASSAPNVADQPMKFADTAVELLIRKMESAGARRVLLKAKIAGGAQMFSGLSTSSIANIGLRNAQAVKIELLRQRIPILAEDTGKNYGRTLYLSAEDGSMKIKSATKGEWNF
ncbi:MAG: chemotaxis protein CheD [Clostridiales bacterium]|nr:chemotaxis protein CheD [Clostridiales bacterium]